MVHCLWNRVVHMHATGYIISLEFHSCKKIVGDSLCICLRLSGNQEYPTVEKAYSKKAGDIDGGVKDNGASLDC